MTHRAWIACGLCMLWVIPAQGAGRRPYGGGLSLPMAHFAGFDDPHTTRDAAGRFGAMLGHCRLLTRDVRGRIGGDAATIDWGKRALRLTLRPGASFHNGAPIRADDVMHSIRRLQSYSRVPSWLRTAAKALSVLKLDGRTLRVSATRRISRRGLDFAAELLARPEFAILHRGRPHFSGRSGCGPFRARARTRDKLDLVAHTGHPLGRPWIETLTVKRLPASDTEIGAFRFDHVDLTFLSSHKYPAHRSTDVGARASLLLVFAPRYRTQAYKGLRAAIRRDLWSRSFARSITALGRPERPTSLWPKAISPIKRSPDPRAASWPGLSRFRVHYIGPERPRTSLSGVAADVARTAEQVGDHLRTLLGAQVTVTVHQDRGLRLPLRSSSRWDAAIVLHEWAADSPAAAALEAQVTMKLPPLNVKSVFRRRVTRWAANADVMAWVIPIAHVSRILHYRRRARLSRGSSFPALDRSWVHR